MNATIATAPIAHARSGALPQRLTIVIEGREVDAFPIARALAQAEPGAVAVVMSAGTSVRATRSSMAYFAERGHAHIVVMMGDAIQADILCRELRKLCDVRIVTVETAAERRLHA